MYHCTCIYTDKPTGESVVDKRSILNMVCAYVLSMFNALQLDFFYHKIEL